MFGFSVNFLAILVASVVAYLFGWLYYSALFGKLWLKLTGLKKMQGSMWSMVVGFIVVFVTGFVLANVIKYVGVGGVWGGITAAFWMWLGFVATTTLNMVLYERRSFQLYLLNNVHILVQLIILGIILSIW